MGRDHIKAVEAFIAAINQHNVAELKELMAEDHTFVDSRGRKLSGRENMAAGWNGYFQMFPDYTIRVETMVENGNVVAIFGSACGTYNGKRGLVPENRIEMPAAWKAIVSDGKIKLWQVYADWTEGCKIIEQDGNQPKAAMKSD